MMSREETIEYASMSRTTPHGRGAPSEEVLDCLETTEALGRWARRVFGLATRAGVKLHVDGSQENGTATITDKRGRTFTVTPSLAGPIAEAIVALRSGIDCGNEIRKAELCAAEGDHLAGDLHALRARIALAEIRRLLA